MITPGLSALIPTPLANVPVVAHGRAGILAALFGLPLLGSLDSLLQGWPDHVNVHLPDVADEASSIVATPHDARKLFDNGMGLLFDDLQRFVAPLAPWLDALRADLGLSRLTQHRCLAYATPADSGTAPHFDQNVNLVVQLQGTKVWRLAPNAHVESPMTRHTMGLPVEAELSTYSTLPLPDAMPADHIEIVLEPGSVLFVPRGVWHATQARTAALSLNFTFTPPTWIDVFSAALRSRLILSDGWRRTADPRSVDAFDELLGALALDATTWTAADILAATEG